MPQDPLEKGSKDIKNALAQFMHESGDVISEYMRDLSEQGGKFGDNPLEGTKTLKKLASNKKNQKELDEYRRLEKESKARETSVTKIKEEENKKIEETTKSEMDSKSRLQKLRVQSNQKNLKEKIYNPEDKK